ncbi:MAG: MGMT family protein [Cytophagales bacterium]|nr:MGMT family protein [Cytophagales bacterium]
MDKKTNFFQDVYEVVKLIPEGRWTSYGAIAHYLGAKGSARMVGWAMNSSHGTTGIPAQRVLNREGRLTGKHHFNPPDRMQKLLEQEGLKIKDDMVVDAETSFWDPSKELEF